MTPEMTERDDGRDIVAEYENESFWSMLSLHPVTMVSVSLGFLLTTIGAFLLNGKLAGMFGVWGATAIVLGIAGQTLLRIFDVM